MVKKILTGLALLLFTLMAVFYWLGRQPNTPSDSLISDIDPSKRYSPEDKTMIEISLDPALESIFKAKAGVLVLNASIKEKIELNKFRTIELGEQKYTLKELPTTVSFQPSKFTEKLMAPTPRLRGTEDLSITAGFFPLTSKKDSAGGLSVPYALAIKTIKLNEIKKPKVKLVIRRYRPAGITASPTIFAAGKISLQEWRKTNPNAAGSAFLFARRRLRNGNAQLVKMLPYVEKMIGDTGHELPAAVDFNNPIVSAWTKIDLSKDEQSFSIPRQGAFFPKFIGPITFFIAQCEGPAAFDPMICGEIALRIGFGDGTETNANSSLNAASTMPDVAKFIPFEIAQQGAIMPYSGDTNLNLVPFNQ